MVQGAFIQGLSRKLARRYLPTYLVGGVINPVLALLHIAIQRFSDASQISKNTRVHGIIGIPLKPWLHLVWPASAVATYSSRPNLRRTRASWLQFGPNLSSAVVQHGPWHVWAQVGLNMRNLVLCEGIWLRNWAQDINSKWQPQSCAATVFFWHTANNNV